VIPDLRKDSLALASLPKKPSAAIDGEAVRIVLERHELWRAT
jgi:hypothetical protein